MGKHRHAVRFNEDYEDDSDYDDDYYYTLSKQPSPSLQPNTKNLKQHIPAKPQLTQPKSTPKPRRPPQARRSLNLSIVGHVDAGKSTLLGNLLHQMDILPQKTVEINMRDAARAGRSSFGLAWCLDEMEEERARGITMDVGVVNFRAGRHWVNAFDTPGHVDYVSKMIEVTCLVDVVVLVVSAARGEFESGFDGGGQTREIITIGRCLDVRRLIVVVNKMDAVEWSNERFLDIRDRVTRGLTNIGFSSDVLFIPCSAFHGTNLLSCSSPEWYNGMSLVEAIDSVTLDEIQGEESFRGVVVGVRRRSNRAGLEIRVLVRSGQFGVGDCVVLLPSRVEVVIRDLSVLGFGGDVAHEGDVADVGLDLAQGSSLEVTEDHIYAGCVLSSEDSPCALHFEAKLHTLKTTVPITLGFTCEMYSNGSCGSVVLSRIDRVIKGKAKKFLSSNSTALVQFECLAPTFITEYDKCKTMGKFILLHNAKTLAVGVVTRVCS